MPYDLYTIVGVGLIILLLLIWVIRLEIKLVKLLGRKDKSLDDALDTLRKDVDYLKKYSENSTNKFQLIDRKLAKTVSGNETVRFNPFQGAGIGGNQSFATSLINSDGDGIIISSMYSRNHVSIFAKPVKNFKSEYELTDEEKDSLQKAKDSLIK